MRLSLLSTSIFFSMPILLVLSCGTPRRAAIDFEKAEQATYSKSHDSTYTFIPVAPGCDTLGEAKGAEYMKCFQKYVLNQTSKTFEYPEQAMKLGIEGRIYVNFVITKEAKVDSVEVVKGIDPILDEEVERITWLLEAAEPAYKNGRPVNISFTLPVNCKIPTTKTKGD